MALIYVASPYSHENKSVRTLRFQKVSHYVAYLVTNRGKMAYSPIVHNHSLMEYGDICSSKFTWEFWKQHDLYFLTRAHKMHVLCIEGYKESIGVQEEILHAMKISVPVVYIDPLTYLIKEENAI